MKSGGPALKIHNCRGVPALKIALQDPVPTSDENLLLLGRCFDRGFRRPGHKRLPAHPHHGAGLSALTRQDYNNDTGDHVPQVLSQPWA
jgi:hypothetical protein